MLCLFFFFNDTATTEIYTLSLHDALPISIRRTSSTEASSSWAAARCASRTSPVRSSSSAPGKRSEEHTSELQSRLHLVCRLLLEKKNYNAAESQPRAHGRPRPNPPRARWR